MNKKEQKTEEELLREKLGIDVAEEILNSKFVLRKDCKEIFERIKKDINKKE